MTYEHDLQYTDGSKINDLSYLPQIEARFFDNTGFLPHTQIPVMPETLRSFIFNEDKSLFYCAPSYHNPFLKIHKTSEIEKVEIFTSNGESGALAGALLFGAAGAIVGAGNKKNIITIRIHFKNEECPFFDFEIMLAAISPKSRQYLEASETAKKIYGQLMSFIKNTDTSTPIAELDNIDQIRRYKELMDDGIITADEFEAKKKQLLSL